MKILFEYNSFIPRIEHRRPEISRHSWLQETFKDAFGILGRIEHYDPDNAEHYRFVI